MKSLRKLNPEAELIRHRIGTAGGDRERLKLLQRRIEDLSAASVRSELRKELEAACTHDWTLKCGYRECVICHKIEITN